MKSHETLLLRRSEVAELLTHEECINAVESAFRMHAEGKAAPPGILGIHAAHGGFHIKAGILALTQMYFVAKTNANFPQNPARHGLPTIQGVIAVSDAENGKLLALMDSIEITILRTGAATAVAAKYLSRANSTTAGIIGCGNQGIISVHMLTKVRKLEKIYAYDIVPHKAEKFARDVSKELNIPVVAIDNVAAAVRQSDICVTCTPSRRPLLSHEDVPAGLFIAAVGSDSDDKQELDPTILKLGKVVTDLTEQSARIGELHHAIDQGFVKKEDVHAELGQVITNQKPGRQSDDEIIVFDSTGMALQDVASAAIVYERAIKLGKGSRISFNS